MYSKLKMFLISNNLVFYIVAISPSTFKKENSSKSFLKTTILQWHGEEVILEGPLLFQIGWTGGGQ